ncbi:hypothetical protein KUCAC02_009707, partial [Chaenocephalus aceratus]
FQLADRKPVDLRALEKELKETLSQLEIQRTAECKLFRYAVQETESDEEQQESVSSENQNSHSGFNIDVDQRRKYIRLRNTSNE